MPVITVELPRELSDFAHSCAGTRHHGSLDKVISNALFLLREREERRHELLATLNAALIEAEREGGHSLEEVMKECKAILAGGGPPKAWVKVEVSEWLAREGKLYGGINHRSVGEQIEHWVRIGQIAEANPSTPYGVIYDECGLGLEPCDVPVGDILRQVREAFARGEQRRLAEAIMREEEQVLKKLAGTVSADGVESPMEPLRAALYVRCACAEPGRDSLNRQFHRLREHAATHGMVVVCDYVDEGKGGLSFDGREGLAGLLEDVRSGKAGFEVVLVTDISRWGRFVDADREIEMILRKHGIRVEYCGP